MEKRTLFAILLSIAVMVGYQALMAKLYPPRPVVEDFQAQEEPADYVPTPVLLPPKETSHTPKDIEEAKIEQNGLHLGLSSQGAVINKILLKEENGEEKEVSLLRQENIEFAPLALWVNSSAESARLNYSLLAEENAAEFSAKLDKDLKVNKKINFSNSKYGIELEVVFENKGSEAKSLDYILVAASGVDLSGHMDKRFAGILSKVDNVSLWESQRKLKSFGNWVEHKGITDWTMMRNTYYEVALKPQQPAAGSAAKDIGENNFACGLKIDKFVVPAGSTVSHKYLLYAGPGSRKHLLPFGLENTIYYGKLDSICKFLLRALGFFYGITRNYGTAIIVLTLAIGALLFPITRKNFSSMRQMQAIQPKISELRDKHKDNPQKLNREMMELYRTHKVNPLGGCLPMFLQMPIFVSLYITLIRAYELKGQAFLWIKDLAEPDAIAALPFVVPKLGWNTLNLLPILMAVAMFAQQKISLYKRAKVDPQTQQQQKMMLIMPVFFGIILYSFPAGLVLYWLTNTVVMTLIQLHIAKTMPSVETLAG